MKANVVTLSEIEIPSQMFAVVVGDNNADAGGTTVALFMNADSAQKWAAGNYAGRFKIVEVRL